MQLAFLLFAVSFSPTMSWLTLSWAKSGNDDILIGLLIAARQPPTCIAASRGLS